MGPADDKASLGAITAQLARRWATQRLTAVEAYGRILSDFGSGRASSASAAGALAKLAAEEYVRYPADAVGIATDFASALARKAGVSVGNSKSRQGPGSRPAIQDLEIAGPLGGVASGGFLLRNPNDQAARLGFVTSNFSGAAGECSVAPRVEPCELTLLAGEEQRVTVLTDVDPDAFEAGGRYSANVAILGFDDMVVRVRLTVQPG